MKLFLQKHGREVVLSVILIVCFACLINVVAHVTNYTNSLNEQSKEKVDFYVYQQKADLQNSIGRLYDLAHVIRHTIEQATTLEAEQNAVRAVPDIIGRDNADYVTLFYFENGNLLNRDFVMDTTYPELYELKNATGDATSKLFQYENRIMSMGISVEVDSPYMDRLILVFGRTAVSNFIFQDSTRTAPAESAAKSILTFFCKHDGVILERVINDALYTEVSTAAVKTGFIRDLLTDTDQYNQVVRYIDNSESGSLEYSKNGEAYVLTVESLGNENGGLFILNLFRLSDLYVEGYGLVTIIWGTLCVFFALLVFLTVFLLITQLSMHRNIQNLSAINKQLNCPTLVRFERDATEILESNKGTQFAITIVRFRNYDYMNEHFGEDAVLDLLKFENNILKSSLSLSEIYAYGADGEFYLLFHYREQKMLVDRLNGLRTRIEKYNRFEDKHYNVRIVFDIYEIEKEISQSTQMMINKAVTVRNATIGNAGTKPMTFYADLSRDTYLKKGEIEGTMEQALRDAEFHIFYQPKFNYEENTVDGSEILVRWFDAKNDRYRQPDVFIPVFEENGFIVKLDHFVFFKACENVIYCQKNNIPVYPISVNVSRVTVMHEDFIEYYTRIKQKFNIPNKFVTLEITESFAFENYEYLIGVIKQLHQAGFLCSLDDFGTGYSSYNILKTLDLDEIKLDRFFIGKGFSDERDNIILKGVIEMVRELGMKSTQEGIETKEDFERLHKLGCDIIQGYYFAKPMKFVHYCEFVSTNFPKRRP